MEIKEAREKVTELEGAIFNAIVKFQKETGMQCPHCIHLVTAYAYGGRHSERLIAVEVHVEL